MSHFPNLLTQERPARYSRDNCAYRAKVRINTIKTNRDNFMVDADCIIFVNRGQNYLLLDEQFVIRPGGWFREKNVCHDYSWRFVTNASPPTADGNLVISGNHVVIRILNGGGESGSDTETFEPAEINTGAISVSTTPATPVVDDPEGELTLATSISIPAGKSFVHIINKGNLVPVGGIFGANASCTVAAGSLSTELPVDPDGLPLKSSGTNTASNEHGTLPAITITNASGAAIWWYAV